MPLKSQMKSSLILKQSFSTVFGVKRPFKLVNFGENEGPLSAQAASAAICYVTIREQALETSKKLYCPQVTADALV
jgi:hypothetical protein